MAYLPKLRSKSESIRTRDSVFDDLFNELYSLPTSFLSKRQFRIKNNRKV
jgi:hypothetical protein